MPKQVIVITKGDEREVHSTLTGICEKFNWFPYHKLKKLDYPFEYNGWTFEKLDYNKQTNKS